MKIPVDDTRHALCPKTGVVDPVVDVKMMPPIKLYGERRRVGRGLMPNVSVTAAAGGGITDERD